MRLRKIKREFRKLFFELGKLSKSKNIYILIILCLLSIMGVSSGFIHILTTAWLINELKNKKF